MVKLNSANSVNSHTRESYLSQDNDLVAWKIMLFYGFAKNLFGLAVGIYLISAPYRIIPHYV
jgi:hypothetical protein